MVNVPAQAILSEALPTDDIVTTPKGVTKLLFFFKRANAKTM